MDNQNLADDGRLVVPYDKDRKTITFYDTFVDINGDVIKYDDIAVIQSGALNSSSMIYFYFSKSFNYNFDFTTYDGTKHRFRRSGFLRFCVHLILPMLRRSMPSVLIIRDWEWRLGTV